MSLLSGIKHFFGAVWNGIAKTEGVIEKDAPGIEADLSLAADVTALVNPAAGLIAKEIVTGGMTALGAFTEALEASTTTISSLVGEAPEFTQVTVRTEALAQIQELFEKYKEEFTTIKDAFVKQAAAGTPTPAAIPAAVAVKS